MFDGTMLSFFRYETTAHLWLVLEYCVGGDLMTLLKQVTYTHCQFVINKDNIISISTNDQCTIRG